MSIVSFFKKPVLKSVLAAFTFAICAFGPAQAEAAEKIRLLFVYDKGAMDYMSNAGADYDTFAQGCVDRMNTVLGNSRLTEYFTYELAGTTLLPGVDNASPSTGYTEGWAALCGNRGEEWAGMLEDRYNKAADVVVLLINTGSYAGLTGNSHPYTGTGSEYAINYAGSAFSVCSIMTAARECNGTANAHQVLSHEVAHTLGCGHSDTQDRQQGPQSTSYSAALQFRLPEGKQTLLPRSASVTRDDMMAYYGTTLMGYSEHFFYKDDGEGGKAFMTRDEVKALMGWTDAQENDIYFDNTSGSYGASYPQGVFCYSYIVPYFSSPDLYFSQITVPSGMSAENGVVTAYHKDDYIYKSMSDEDKAKLVPMGDEAHNNRQVLIDNYQYASRWHLGVKFSKDGNESVVNGASDKISLAALSKGCTIYYTTDGTEPTTENGTKYTKPFSVTEATTIKARAYDSNGKAGDVLSKSYTMLPLATALGNTELTWTTSAPAWKVNGSGVAQSGAIAFGESGESSISTVVYGPNRLQFEYNLADFGSETFTLTIDGDVAMTVTSGNGWQTSEEIAIAEGEHNIVWTFSTTDGFSDVTYLGLRNVTLLDESAEPEDPPEEPEEPAVEPPTAAAVWDGNFSPSELTKFSGFTLVDWNTTHGGAKHTWGATEGVDYSDSTVDKDNQGLMLRSSSGLAGITVLVRYSNLQPGTLKRVLFTSTIKEDYTGTQSGIRLGANGTLRGLWGAGDWEDANQNRNPESESGLINESGTLAFTYSNAGTYLYKDASSHDFAEVWKCAALMADNDTKDSRIRGASIGGYCEGVSSNGYEAAKGMTISKLAVFDKVLSAAEMNAYLWPSEIETIEIAADTSASQLNGSISQVGEDIRKIVISVTDGVTIDIDEDFVSTLPVEVKSNGAITLTGYEEYEGKVYENFDFTGVVGGTTFVVKSPPYSGPEPTAVWVSGEFLENADLHSGYTVVTNAGNTINADGNIVIGQDAELGATIAIHDNTHIKVSVLVKFKLSSNQAPADNSVIAGMLDTFEKPFGAICTTSGTSALTGYWQNGTSISAASYGFASTAPGAASGEQFMLLSYYSADDDNSKYGVKFYTGDSVSNLSGGQASGLQFRKNKVSQVSVGGPTGGSAAPWSGLEIEGIALFVDSWLSPEDIEGYEFPEPEAPAEKYTETDFPVPHSWFVDYDETLTSEEAIEAKAATKAANGKNTWWQCYVLGLDPTTADAEFKVSITMDGTTPVITYSPTNTALKTSGAIKYKLQGKPKLTDDWGDCNSFDDPGEDNRFFRVKVTW